MEQIIETFGIDGKLIMTQVFNFALLAVALTYFLYKPILKMLANREEQIEQGIKDSEDAAKSKASAYEEKKGILASAHKDAEEVGVNAKNFADEKAVEISAEAQIKSENIIKNAELKSAEIKEQARKDSESEIAKIAILTAEKVLRS